MAERTSKGSKNSNKAPGVRRRAPGDVALAASMKLPGHGESGELDRIIHEPVRLGIMSVLAVHPEVSFNDLKGVLDVTDGNLSVHARRLEEAGYVHCEKAFEGRLPRTAYRLTSEGRLAFDRYLDRMEAIIKATRAS